MSVVVETTIGNVTIDLFVNEKPRAVLNFLKLCKLKYYNFNVFHTVRRDFIAQTGDPTGTSRGGSSAFGLIYGDQARFFETEKKIKIRHKEAGTVSFASHGDNTYASQFFITLHEDLFELDSEHCPFGRVVEGSDVLLKINSLICNEKHRPYKDVRIMHTVILDDPFPDPEGLVVPQHSPRLTREHLVSDRLAIDESFDNSTEMTAEELQEMIEDREAVARATVLEMVGDIPDVDVAPPENVLFICKLNPVTQDDDLKVIFSRFGEIVSAEIIRDPKTKASLQYGFIEFSNSKSCEDAYFKMDNVLIDDRRVHVDFSQSVSRLKNRGTGRFREVRRHSSNREYHRKTDTKSKTVASKLSEIGVDKLKALLEEDSSQSSDETSDNNYSKKRRHKSSKNHDRWRTDIKSHKSGRKKRKD